MRDIALHERDIAQVVQQRCDIALHTCLAHERQAVRVMGCRLVIVALPSLRVSNNCAMLRGKAQASVLRKASRSLITGVITRSR
jgi:hypothetical protein